MLRFLLSVAGLLCVFCSVAIPNTTNAQIVSDQIVSDQTDSDDATETEIGFKISVPSAYELQWLTGDGSLSFPPAQTAGSHEYFMTAGSRTILKLWLHPVHNPNRRRSKGSGFFVSFDVSDLPEEEMETVKLNPPVIDLSPTLESLRKSKDFDINQEDYVHVVFMLQDEHQGRVAGYDSLGNPGASETELLKSAERRGNILATIKLTRSKDFSLASADYSRINGPLILPFTIPQKTSLGHSPDQHGTISKPWQRSPNKTTLLNVSIDAHTTARLSLKDIYGLPNDSEVRVEIKGLPTSQPMVDAVAMDSITLWYDDDKNEILNGHCGVRCLYVPDRPDPDDLSLVQFYQKWPANERDLEAARQEVVGEASNLGTPIATVIYRPIQNTPDDPAVAEVKRKLRELIALSHGPELDVDNIGKQLADHYRMILKLKWDQQKQLIQQQEKALAKLRERIRMQEENSDALIKRKIDEILSGVRTPE